MKVIKYLLFFVLVVLVGGCVKLSTEPKLAPREFVFVYENATHYCDYKTLKTIVSQKEWVELANSTLIVYNAMHKSKDDELTKILPEDLTEDELKDLCLENYAFWPAPPNRIPYPIKIRNEKTIGNKAFVKYTSFVPIMAGYFCYDYSAELKRAGDTWEFVNVTEIGGREEFCMYVESFSDEDVHITTKEETYNQGDNITFIFENSGNMPYYTATCFGTIYNTETDRASRFNVCCDNESPKLLKVEKTREITETFVFTNKTGEIEKRDIPAGKYRFLFNIKYLDTDNDADFVYSQSCSSCQMTVKVPDIKGNFTNVEAIDSKNVFSDEFVVE